MEIPNFYIRAVALLAGQFQDQPTPSTYTNLQKLLQAICDSADNVQNQIQLLIYQRALQTAQGVQLDGLGKIVGLARKPNQPDDSATIDGVYVTGYREDLIFQIFLNNSSGTPEQVMKAAAYITNSSKVWYLDNFPASYIIEANGLPASYNQNPNDLVEFMQSLSPAGVEFSAWVATYDYLPFTFATDATLNPFYVSPDPTNPLGGNQLELNSGGYLYVNRGGFEMPLFGGSFAEYDPAIQLTPGAGQLTEAIMLDSAQDFL